MCVIKRVTCDCVCVCTCAASNSVLADYEYVQQCLNLDHDIKFVIVDIDSVQKPFRRTVRMTHFTGLYVIIIIFTLVSCHSLLQRWHLSQLTKDTGGPSVPNLGRREEVNEMPEKQRY